MSTLPQDLTQQLHDLYRHLHAHPELSMQESVTATLIEERMGVLGWRTLRCGGTGVVAILENGAGPVVGFRADTDALPVAEETGLPYASTARGTLPDGTDVPVMHACGHDTHITAAIGAATLLTERREDWSGTVVLVFQPGEETAAGAVAMLADGLWDKAPRPEVMFAQHVSNGLAGTIRLSSGPAMAMADSLEVTVHGTGGHASRPADTVDPVLLAAHMVVRLQGIVSREVSAQEAAVVSVATFHAGLKENIIPSQAVFTVNIRSLEQSVRERLLAAVRRVLSAEAAASGAPEPDVRELYTFPLLANDPAETARVTTVLANTLGADLVAPRPAQMGSEDFGALPDALGIPGVYWFFGGLAQEVIDAPEPTPSNHSPHFAPVLEPTLSTATTAAYAVIRSHLA
ncbi:amidohydrolase [Ornithinimicrobium faecis]|uniref:Amidohydrolase n=1 Tax=Ornithinimicrobium faecis TaxID=2934158 RepID=A0ABY4YTC4_9MICO|nr:amidohydrolase [Ornithinimicrobium sp. HY1793]USQ79979.1 amidohydrolase [Ornithinimicrobium sp. HY1793]